MRKFSLTIKTPKTTLMITLKTSRKISSNLYFETKNYSYSRKHYTKYKNNNPETSLKTTPITTQNYRKRKATIKTKSKIKMTLKATLKTKVTSKCTKLQ